MQAPANEDNELDTLLLLGQVSNIIIIIIAFIIIIIIIIAIIIIIIIIINVVLNPIILHPQLVIPFIIQFPLVVQTHFAPRGDPTLHPLLVASMLTAKRETTQHVQMHVQCTLCMCMTTRNSR